MLARPKPKRKRPQTCQGAYGNKNRKLRPPSGVVNQLGIGVQQTRNTQQVLNDVGSLQTIMNSVSTATGKQKSQENLSRAFVLDMQKKQDLSYLGMTKTE